MDSSQKSQCERSHLYRLYILQREEVLKHKWIESEKAGRDVGFEWALVDWMVKYRSKWLKSLPK